MLESEKFLRFHAEVIANIRIIPSLLKHRENHVRHASDTVTPSSSIVSHCGSHAVIHALL